MDYSGKIKTLAKLIQGSSRTFALTGAGISTESGIPDFRSPGTGLWQKTDPMKVATVTVLRRDPAAFYKANLERWSVFTEAEPNAAHYALAALEREGLLEGVISQNIDGLHVKAGSERVWEVHGHLRTCHCMKCNGRQPFSNLLEQFKSGINPPLCICGGVLRPDVVLFEDPMGEDFFHASQALNGCQLLVVVGSSLRVYPVAHLPERAARLVIVNRDATPWDDRAALVINDSAGKVFTDLMTELKQSSDV
ncbi:MAG: NAD-dependent deacylase [Firmicutes bacterium]|nr:NAD-dependent deacylase [Bacillota bacterium]